jgi:hypothetical protein
MPTQARLFTADEAPRRPRRVLMHVVDAGNDCILFRCHKCGHSTGWLVWDAAIGGVAKAKRGRPCPVCNGGADEAARA